MWIKTTAVTAVSHIFANCMVGIYSSTPALMAHEYPGLFPNLNVSIHKHKALANSIQSVIQNAHKNEQWVHNLVLSCIIWKCLLKTYMIINSHKGLGHCIASQILARWQWSGSKRGLLHEGGEGEAWTKLPGFLSHAIQPKGSLRPSFALIDNAIYPNLIGYIFSLCPSNHLTYTLKN